MKTATNKSMTRELFRVTVDEPNYSNVLGESVNKEQKLHLPNHIDTANPTHIWAINVDSPAADTYHNYMSEGDGLLFYKVTRGLASDEKMYVGTGVIGEQFTTDADAAAALFNTASARLMFTVEHFEPTLKSVEEVEPILGYKQHPQRTQRVKPDRYQSVESVLDQLTE